MDEIFKKLLDSALGGLGTVAGAMVPDEWKRRAAAALRDRNPLADIALNHDLLRAVRLAWIEAALDVVEAVRATEAAKSKPDDDVGRFASLAAAELRAARSRALDANRHPGRSPIDDHAAAVIAEVSEVVAPGPPAAHGAAIGAGFVATLAALTLWPAGEIPASFARIAASGLAVKGGPSRPFGELAGCCKSRWQFGHGDDSLFLC